MCSRSDALAFGAASGQRGADNEGQKQHHAEAVDRQPVGQLVGAEVDDEAGHDTEAGQPERRAAQAFAQGRPLDAPAEQPDYQGQAETEHEQEQKQREVPGSRSVLSGM